MGSITVCPVHIFPPPTELLVCYQPHRQKVMPGQKSIYETFLDRTPSKATIHGYHDQQSLPSGVIFLQLARRGALPARCSMYMFFLCRDPDALLLVPAFPPPATVLGALVKCGFHLRGSFPVDPEVRPQTKRLED